MREEERWRRGLQDGVMHTAEQLKGALAGPHEPGFLSRSDKMSMKHNFEKAAFSPSDVTHQEKGCLFPLKKHARWMF